MRIILDLFITADQDLRYQQNLAGRRNALQILSANNRGLVKEHIAEIIAAINTALC